MTPLKIVKQSKISTAFLILLSFSSLAFAAELSPKSTTISIPSSLKLSLQKSLASQAMQLNIKSEMREGGSHGGGGSGIVLPNGEIYLIDLLSDRDVTAAAKTALNYSEVINQFYRPQQFVHQAATEDAEFFSCASDLFGQNAGRYPVLNRLIQSLKGVRVLQVEFQIASTGEGPNYDKLSLQYPLLSTTSHRLPSDRQVALATYANSQLWVARRLVSQLSATDRCGLSVHEGLRHLNFSRLIQVPLTQDEIESATRLMMGLEIDSNAKRDLEFKLLNETPSSEEILRAANALNIETKVALEKLLALGERPRNPTAAAKWDRQASIYQDEINVASARNSKQIAQSALVGTNGPSILSLLSTGIVGRAMIEGSLTRPLEGAKRWDVINYVIVNAE